MVRKGGRTSKSQPGAKRRGVIMTVLATLNTRFEAFTFIRCQLHWRLDDSYEINQISPRNLSDNYDRRDNYDRCDSNDFPKERLPQREKLSSLLADTSLLAPFCRRALAIALRVNF